MRTPARGWREKAVSFFRSPDSRKRNEGLTCSDEAVRLALRSRKHPNDGDLAGLLTCASPKLCAFPVSQWHHAQLLSVYSCGAVADSHRLPDYQMGDL